jgi:hypothetical protein
MNGCVTVCVCVCAYARVRTRISQLGTLDFSSQYEF